MSSRPYYQGPDGTTQRRRSSTASTNSAVGGGGGRKSFFGSIASLGGGTRTSVSSKRHSRTLSKAEVEEDEFFIGGRYEVYKNIALWHTPELDAAERLVRVGILKEQDVVMVIRLDEQKSTGHEVALVVPANGGDPGWLAADSSLVRPRLEGSWEQDARYLVEGEVTLRKERWLSSEVVGSALRGEEVTVIELDSNDGEKKQMPRLRMLVSNKAGVIGWMSPSTASGTRLLRPDNLLRSDVEVKPRKSLSVGLQKTAIDCLPWQVGGKYRIVQREKLRQKASLTSKEMGKISVGSLVVISEIEQVPCPSLGWCPCAYVSVVGESPELGRTGWMRCAGKDGLDVIDSRNFNEVAQVKHKFEHEQELVRLAEQAKLDAQLQAEERAREEQAEEEELERREIEEEMLTQEEPLATKTKEKDHKIVPCVTSNSLSLLGCFGKGAALRTAE